MEKKHYTKPEMEVIEFENDAIQIITTSVGGGNQTTNNTEGNSTGPISEGGN